MTIPYFGVPHGNNRAAQDLANAVNVDFLRVLRLAGGESRSSRYHWCLSG